MVLILEKLNEMTRTTLFLSSIMPEYTRLHILLPVHVIENVRKQLDLLATLPTTMAFSYSIQLLGFQFCDVIAQTDL